MPFDRPTLDDLVEQLRANLKTRLGLTGPVLRRSMAEIIAQVSAGGFHQQYGSIQRLSLQLFVDTADREQLIRVGSFYGLEPDPATFASGNVTATGVNGTNIPAGTAFVYDEGDRSVRYLSTAAVLVAGGTATVNIQAELAGQDGTIPVTVGFENQTLEIETPILGLNDTLTVAAGGITGGNDEQSTESFRAELIAFFQSRPAGGNDDDYEEWAKSVPGVTRVWVYGNNPLLGQVTVVFVRDDDDTTIIPDPGEVADVLDAVDVERPTTAEVFVQAPVEEVQPYTISITPDTAENRTAVEAELDDLHRTLEAGDGAGRGTLYIFQVNAAIGRVPLTTATVTVPAGDVVPDEFELITRGSVTWA